MKKSGKKITAILLALVFTFSAAAVIPVTAAPGGPTTRAINASISGDGIYVEVDENMSMSVYRVEENGGRTLMTQPVTALDENGATAVAGAPWKGELPWSAGNGTEADNFNDGSAKLLSEKSAYVTTGTRSTGDVVGDEIAVDDFVMFSARSQDDITTYFGTGDRLTVIGESESTGLLRTVMIETTDRVPGVISVTTSYTNESGDDMEIARFVENNFKIKDELPAEDYIAEKREAGLWTQQGQAAIWGADYVLPVYSTMGTNQTAPMNDVEVDGDESRNPTLISRNNWFWAENGGLPFNDYWGQNVGILVGSAMPYMVRSMEIPTRGSGIADEHDTAYTWVGFPGQTLEPGVETEIGTTIVGVHTGDNYAGSKQFREAMSYISDLEINGTAVASDWFASPDTSEFQDDAWGNTWESWGGGENFDPIAAINYVNNGVFKDLGIKYVILDACWYPRGTSAGATLEQAQAGGEGGYIAIPTKWQAVADYFGMPNENTDDTKKVVRAFNDFMHENGLKTAAWCMPMSFYLGRDMTAQTSYTQLHPDYFITENEAKYDPVTGQLLPDSPAPVYKRQAGYYPQSGTAELCLGNPRVLDEYTDYFTQLIFEEYGFDGLKIDTQWGIQQCNAIGHNHDGNPDAPAQNYSLYWKIIYDKAKAILGEEPWMKHCQCGTMMSFFTQNGTNRPITGDPGGNNVRKARYSMRMWKGLYGDDATAVSDHVENYGGRAKSLMAAGYIMESKFYNIDGDAPSAAIQKYFPMAADLGLSSGYFMDEYKFGFDYPEALAYDKPEENLKYYGVFASSAPVSGFTGGSRYTGGGEANMKYEGAFELRGLEPNQVYTVNEIDGGNVRNVVVTADADGHAMLENISFTEVMLLKAEQGAVERENISIDDAFAIYAEQKDSEDVFGADFMIDNLDDEEKTVTVILAGYDGDNKLAAVKAADYTIAANTGILAQPSLALNEDIVTCKFFIWQDGVKPLTAVTGFETP